MGIAFPLDKEKKKKKAIVRREYSFVSIPLHCPLRKQVQKENKFLLKLLINDTIILIIYTIISALKSLPIASICL